TRDAEGLEAMAGLDRYMLRQTARMAQEVEREYAEYNFHKAYRRLADFCAVELSAVYFDVLKDRLYTSARSSLERRSAQTALERILAVLVRLFAPILPFTAEEVWAETSTGSVHLQEYVDVGPWLAGGDGDDARWALLFAWRDEVLKVLEVARQEKRIGTGLEAAVTLTANPEEAAVLRQQAAQLPALFIVSEVQIEDGGARAVRVERATGQKCERCWNYKHDVGESREHPTLCRRCVEALRAGGKTQDSMQAGSRA